MLVLYLMRSGPVTESFSVALTHLNLQVDSLPCFLVCMGGVSPNFIYTFTFIFLLSFNITLLRWSSQEEGTSVPNCFHVPEATIHNTSLCVYAAIGHIAFTARKQEMIVACWGSAHFMHLAESCAHRMGPHGIKVILPISINSIKITPHRHLQK